MNFKFGRETQTFCYFCTPDCPGGGIGRHAGLKILWLHGCTGSSPVPGTKAPNIFFRCFFYFQNLQNALTAQESNKAKKKTELSTDIVRSFHNDRPLIGGNRQIIILDNNSPEQNLKGGYKHFEFS